VTLNNGSDELGRPSSPTLTPADHAFLESAPTYEERDSLQLSVAPPPIRREPPYARRIVSLLLFVGIAGSASVLLGLAAIRLLGHTLFQ
jgi:hypothetical protein